MLATLVFTVLVNAQAPPEELPIKKELFAQEKWYQDQKGKEEDFVGVLSRAAEGNKAGAGRHNPYRLTIPVVFRTVQLIDGQFVESVVDGGTEVREVYVGGKPDLLAPYAGMRVRLTGKAVDMKVEGREHREIWPARLELVLADARAAGAKEAKILARGPWRAPIREGGEPQQLVIRSAEELVVASGQRDKAKDEATQKQVTAAVAQALKAGDIDWKKQMLVVVTGGVQRSGGYSVDVTGAEVRDKDLVVRWRLNAPPAGAPVTLALTHPAQAVLLERHDGPVRFDPPARK
jgi:hypothetical protein